MSNRKINFVQGEYYHLYNRGNSKQKIFMDEEDYLHFIGLLYGCNNENNLKLSNLNKKQNIYDLERGEPLVGIGAYCLMPNHFHILIAEIKDGGISKFMQKLSTAYVMYFNKKYKRTGSLFEGKFKSIHMKNNTQIKYLFSYIHLNPVKLIQKDWKEKGIIDKKEALIYLNKYLYSSYLDFIGEQRVQNKILRLDLFPNYFPSKNIFNKEIFEWLSFREK